MRRGKGIISIALTFVFLSSFTYRLQVENEYELKAAFLYNFTKYIEWENLSSYKNFVINIAGDSHIKKPLEEIALSKKVNNKSIKVNQVNSDELGFSHILFIPESRSSKWIYEHVGKEALNNTLVVCESPGSLDKGAAINFLIVEDKIKFEINKGVIERSNLKASSQLLKLAMHIKD